MWDDCALLQVSICDMANLVLTMACWPGTALVEKNASTHAKDLPIDAKPASLVKCNGSCAWAGLDMASWIWNVMFCGDSVIRLCLCCDVLCNWRNVSPIPFGYPLQSATDLSVRTASTSGGGCGSTVGHRPRPMPRCYGCIWMPFLYLQPVVQIVAAPPLYITATRYIEYRNRNELSVRFSPPARWGSLDVIWFYHRLSRLFSSPLFLLVLHCELQRSGDTAGPQPQAPDLGHFRTSARHQRERQIECQKECQIEPYINILPDSMSETMSE